MTGAQSPTGVQCEDTLREKGSGKTGKRPEASKLNLFLSALLGCLMLAGLRVQAAEAGLPGWTVNCGTDGRPG